MNLFVLQVENEDHLAPEINDIRLWINRSILPVCCQQLLPIINSSPSPLFAQSTSVGGTFCLIHLQVATNFPVACASWVEIGKIILLTMVVVHLIPEIFEGSNRETRYRKLVIGNRRHELIRETLFRPVGTVGSGNVLLKWNAGGATAQLLVHLGSRRIHIVGARNRETVG